MKFIQMLPFLLLLLTGCGTQPYLSQHSAFIVFKTPTVRFADQGFIYENKETLKVEIYGSGQALFTLKVSPESVCTSTFSCLSKQAFNTQVLSGYYPENMIEKIFRGKPLLDGMNLKKKRNGFTQKILLAGKYAIEYSVLNNEIVFRDTINHILIKIKKV